MYLELIVLFVLTLIARALYLVHKITTGFSKVPASKRTAHCKTIICVGSGGHTTEMLMLVQTLDFDRYSPRYYIMANTDHISSCKIHAVEKTKSNAQESTDYKIIEIPRSRHVKQSYFTSIFTTLYSVVYSIPVVCRIRPDLILCNGPGTCVPICFIAFMLKVLFICDTRIIFIESFCRTRTFSLTGKILRYIADNVVVQWPYLKTKMKQAEYIGQLI